MKKFFGNFLIMILVLLISVAAVPWNDISQWGVALPILTNNEMYIKAGIGGLALIVSLVYLFLGNSEYRNYGLVNRNTARVAFLPLYMFAISMMIFGGLLNYHIYLENSTSVNLLIVALFGIVTLNLIVFGHFFGNNFREEKNGRRVAHFVLLVEFMAISGGLTYWFYTYKLSNYAAMNSYYFAGLTAFGILLYLLHMVFTSIGKKRHAEETELEAEIEELVEHQPRSSRKGSKDVDEDKKHRSKRKNSKNKSNIRESRDEKRTMIVSNQQTIVSSDQNIDPTNMIYEDVQVDPEFTKTSSLHNQPNSIEYYIEKPKMFKPLDPTFDQLVAYVRELPQVVTKLDDDRITFYVDRNPFLVLMNFGNYYRVAFKYDLEKGIRLIIKYPTISKNKSTREELWFKANNYGDIPKEVVYQIVKSSYDNTNL